MFVLTLLSTEANPALTYRDVMHVIAKSAVKNDITNRDWVTNSGGKVVYQKKKRKKFILLLGYHHNHNYGFGRIDALQTINIAKSWVNVPKQLEFIGNRITVNQPIRVGSVTSFSYGVTSDIDFVEHVSLTFQANHPHRGQIEVYLISPDGTKSILATRHSDTTRNYPAAGMFSLFLLLLVVVDSPKDGRLEQSEVGEKKLEERGRYNAEIL
jgi:Proprotein convertase P-domain